MESEFDMNGLVARMQKAHKLYQRLFPLIAAGKNNIQIGAQLDRTPQSINASMSKLYGILKLDMSLGHHQGRRELIAKAWKIMHGEIAPITAAAPESPEPRFAATSDVEPREPAHHEQPRAIPELPSGMISMSTAFYAPHEIRGIRIVSSLSGDFETYCRELISKGYFPELMNEYQSVSHPHTCVTRVVFVNRKDRA